MLKDIIAVGGAGYLIPAVLFGLALYVARGLFGWHGRRSQQRKEFLDLWDATRSRDDLWLEVAVRHLFGTYLPARVIRLALSRPDKTQGLCDISELWPLLRFDPESQTVEWAHLRHRTRAQRKFCRYLLLAGYVGCAVLTLISVVAAVRFGPATFYGWMYGTCAVVSVIAAYACLTREDVFKLAADKGCEWVARINQPALASDASEVNLPPSSANQLNIKNAEIKGRHQNAPGI